MGPEPPGPGSSVLQTTFSSSLHFAGSSFFSGLTPELLGPRKFGQSAAPAGRVVRARPIANNGRVFRFIASLLATGLRPRADGAYGIPGLTAFGGSLFDARGGGGVRRQPGGEATGRLSPRRCDPLASPDRLRGDRGRRLWMTIERGDN